MKKLFRHISITALAVLLVLCMAATAFAADGSVTYSGGGEFEFGPGSDLSDTQLFEDLENAMPGDVLTQRVTVTNESSDSDYIKIYMRAEAHDDSNKLETAVKEHETEVTANDFLAQLSMTVMNGNTKIYEASPDKTAGLTEPVLLGRLEEGQSLDLLVTLTVPADLGNEYANRRGEVDWIFTVEELNEDASIDITLTETSEPEDPNGYQEGETIEYEIVVTNDGNVTLTDVVVTDPETGETWTIDKLEPGESVTFETSHKVTAEDVAKGSFENTAYATGIPDNPELAPVSDSDGTGNGAGGNGSGNGGNGSGSGAADDPDHAKGYDPNTGKVYSGRKRVVSKTYKSEPAPAPAPPQPPAPQTGDTFKAGVWAAIGIVAVLALIALLVLRRKKSE